MECEDQPFVIAVANRWFAQAPEAWREEGIDSGDDLRKDVAQVLRCREEVLNGE